MPGVSLLTLYGFPAALNAPFTGPGREREVNLVSVGSFNEHRLFSTLVLDLAPPLGPAEVLLLERSLPAYQLLAKNFGPDACGKLITLTGSMRGGPNECLYLASEQLETVVANHRERLRVGGAPGHPGLRGLVETVLAFLTTSAGLGFDVLSFSDFKMRAGD